MHPEQGDTHQSEQQHEAAGPKPGEIVERAERDGKYEAAEPADHPDQAANGADIFRIVDGDVLVNGSLAQGHEEAEHKDDHREWDDPHFEVEGAWSCDRADNVVSRRIREHKGAGDTDQESPVHDAPRAIAI